MNFLDAVGAECDARLDRDVAIKVLPDSMTRGADRIARFEREAKVPALLNHPHIGAIHGFGVRRLETGRLGEPRRAVSSHPSPHDGRAAAAT